MSEAQSIRAKELSHAHSLLRTDPKRALAEFERLAAEGSPLSMIYLGEAHQLGTGVPIDLNAAERWFALAEQAGSPRASYLLGRLYLKQKRYDAAREAFQRGAEKDFVPAVHFLGRLYFAGIGVEKNPKLGEQLLRRAAKAGNIYAKAGLGQHQMRNYPGIRMRLTGFITVLSAGFSLLKVLLTKGATSDRLR